MHTTLLAALEAGRLHDAIMNLPAKYASMYANQDELLAYKIGHRDARHAAAELANEQDTAIRSLLDENKRLREAVKLAFDHIDIHSLRISHCKDAEKIESAAALSGEQK